MLTPREVGEALGLGKTAVARLIFLGRAVQGRHPLWGGLWPVFKLGRARRVAAEAVQAHLAHMARLESDGAFAAVCSARAGEARFAGVVERYRGFTSGGAAAGNLDGVKEQKGAQRMGFWGEGRAVKGVAARVGLVAASGGAVASSGRKVIGNRSFAEVKHEC